MISRTGDTDFGSEEQPMQIDDAISFEIENAVLCWLATVDSRGEPSVSPKEIWAQYDRSSIVVADIASANSVRNIKKNPRVCLSFIDIFRQKGFKLHGTAAILPVSDPNFARVGARLLEKAGSTFTVRHIIHLHVHRASPIIAPSYRAHPGIDEEEMRRAAHATYGVRPL